VKRHSADTILLFSGLDPTGAAGVTADIETINHFELTPLPNYYFTDSSKYSESRLIRGDKG